MKALALLFSGKHCIDILFSILMPQTKLPIIRAITFEQFMSLPRLNVLIAAFRIMIKSKLQLRLVFNRVDLY